MTKGKLAVYAAIALALLLVLRALSVWMGCDEGWGKACQTNFYFAFLGPLRFRWIYTYKELIAGTLAAAAGLTAIGAVRMQIAANEAARRRDKADRIRTAFSTVANDFTRAILSLARTNGLPPIDMQLSRSALSTISEASVAMAETAAQAIHAVEMAAVEMAAAKRNNTLLGGAGYVSAAEIEDVNDAVMRAGLPFAIAGRFYFRDAAAFVRDDGTFSYGLAKPDPMMRQAYQFGLTRDDIPIEHLFDWEKLTVTPPTPAPGDF
jgi:hypothetical protein